jgi:hypothetical protein
VFLNRRAAIVTVAVVLCCAAFRPAAADSIVPSYIYGIADDNWIWQFNPAAGQQGAERTFNTGLSGNSNAVAFDRGRDQLFFLDSTNNLYIWNKPLGGSPSEFQQIATSAQLGISSSSVYDAAYYNNAFWFFKDLTKDLVKASLSYSGTAAGTIPSLSSTTTYSVTGVPNTVGSGYNTFGDIAIKDNGILYAATTDGRFYSVNLADPENGYSSIKNVGDGLSMQLSFNEDYTTLYGQVYTTAEWYTIDLETGDRIDLGFATPSNGVSGPGFRDLGGASVNDVTPVPEIDPSSFGSAIAMLLGAFGLLERRSLRRLAFLSHG